MPRIVPPRVGTVLTRLSSETASPQEANRERASWAGECAGAGFRPQGQRDLIGRIALRRLGTPEDIAYGVLFFASDAANWITGQVISVDGGK